jgi:hypothetical protein
MWKVIEEITDRMRKISHVSVQTWRGWNLNGLFGGWFSATGEFKTLIRTCPGSMFNIILPGSLSIVIYQDHYEGQYRKKNNCPYDAVEI